MISVGDVVVDLKREHRGSGVVQLIVDDKASVWYPRFDLTTEVRIRDLQKEVT